MLPQLESDRAIKLMLRQFKKLELAVDKFRAKHSGLTRANILRMLLLPFLRLLPLLEALFVPLLKIYLSFVSVLTTVLGEWWRVLLLLLSTPPNALGTQVSTTDRSAYLECISRIMARPEWSSADLTCRQTYYGCLADTLDFCINRLLLTKVVLISMLAFVGKVFAYGFFHLPNVCNALLFLLNVKQSMVDVHTSGAARITPAELADASRAFPKHLAHLIDYRGLTKLDRCKRPVINSIPPPKHPVAGIRDPGGTWVRRWCSSDSDIFNSFFRHYVEIVDSLILSCPDLLPEAFPGFHIISSHIFQIFLVSVNRISANINKPALLKGASQPQKKSLLASEDMAPLPTTFPYKQNDTNYTSIIKLFKTIRDVNYLSVVFLNQLTRYIDLLLINVAKSISIFDFNKNGLLLNLVYEYSNHVLDTSNINWEFWLGCNYLMLTATHHVQTVLRSFAFLFNVWDKIPGFLTKHDDPHSVSYLRGWLLDVNESYKLNFSDWLTSSNVWLTYFTHWNSIVRGYYSRLLVWRIIGVNNYQLSVSMKTTKRAKYKLDFVYESICEILSSKELTQLLANLDFSADHPMLSRKFSILPINSKFAYTDDLMTLTAVTAISKTSDLRKTHPYEIFDEAIYTCTSLPSSPSHTEANLLSPTQPTQKVPRNHSLINSLSRLFKILSTEDSGEPTQFGMVPPNRILGERHDSGSLKQGRNSKLMTSLSSISVRSRLSSPSLMSFSLSPNTDNSADLSVKSDLDSSSFMLDYLGSSLSSSYSALSYQPLQPPELFKIPPEIVRPVFKFDIIVDQESAGERYMMMQSANSERARSKFVKGSNANLSFATMPKEPKVPAVSIYLNSDMYNKFYITKEDYTVDDEILSESDMKDLATFSRQFAQCLRSPTDLMAMGKSLNEWNQIVHEFEYYLFNKVEADQANYFPVSAGEDSSVVLTIVEINEGDYFKRIIPFLSIDNFTEVKLLNAA